MHSKILSQKQWIVKCSTCLGYLLVHAVIVHRAQGHRLIQKTIEKCIEKSFYMSQLPWRRLSSLHLLSCKNMKNKKIVNNYFLTPDLKHTQSLSLFLCHCLTFMMCCQHKKYTHHDPEMHTWDQDTPLSTQAFFMPVAIEPGQECVCMSGSVHVYKKQQCVALFVLCTDCQSINNASLGKKILPWKKFHISFFPGLKAFWIHVFVCGYNYCCILFLVMVLLGVSVCMYLFIFLSLSCHSQKCNFWRWLIEL